MKPRCTEKTEMETIAMPEPLVSIIVPAYNAAGFISRCVESITSQSYPCLLYTSPSPRD